ncbi:ATP-binding cassette domain-containing protein [Lactobacillus sp. ESL0684]|uniref:ATP-binding cassette domain-containing protein n=1 Tax=Lactobacillus sp. ESL0684 TaxID=2983213 RepID=UPI0023F92390|nr:ATP-binding cassette domain-containing protein [Lactobacillus sp. ESL0684]WEV43863.1 ATP-binding cassette domain-containing protein [Lactobacillus sp. ESL0684]
MKIILKDLFVTYNKKNRIFKNFNGSLDLTKLNIIIGKNGIGKTTMLDTISGLTRIESGRIFGVPKQKDIMYVFQNVPFFTDVTVSQLLKMYTSFNTSEQKVNSLSKDFFYENINPLLSRNLGILSGGEVRLVFDYASTLVSKKLYLFDEPLSGIDIENKKKILKLLEVLSCTAPVIVTSHDLEPFENISCTVNYISPSSFMFSGSYKELLKIGNGNIEDAFLNLTLRMKENER